MCLDAHAHGMRVDHDIFRTPHDVTLTLGARFSYAEADAENPPPSHYGLWDAPLDALLAIARQDASEWGGGIVHLRNRGETTWYAFAREILDQAGFEDVAIDPVPSSAFETAAKRPLFSVLDCSWAESKGIAMPPWKDALTRYLASDDCPYDPVVPPVNPLAAPDPLTAPNPLAASTLAARGGSV